MGRPLFGANTLSEACTCPTCVSSSTVAQLAQPTTSTSTSTSQHFPSQPLHFPVQAAAEDTTTVRAAVAESDVLQVISESRRFLRDASSAIEATHTRLLHLQHRLRQSVHRMSSASQNMDASVSASTRPERSTTIVHDTMPSQTSTFDDPAVDGGISQGPDPAHEGTETASNAANGLMTIRQRFAELAGRLEELDSSIRPPPDRLNVEAPRRRSPGLFGPRPPTDHFLAPMLAPRRAFNLSSLYARGSDSDDPQTLLGRRVEARESALRAPSSDHVRSDLQDFMDTADHSLTLLARHGQQLLASAREFRQSIPGVSSEASEGPRPTPVFPIPVSHPPAARQFTSRERSALWRQNMRDRRPLNSSDGRNSVIVSMRRMEGDSSPRSPPPLMPVHETSNSRVRTISTADMPDLTDLTDDEVDDPTNRRSYRVRRRLNPEGGVDTVVDEFTDRPSWDSWQTAPRRPRTTWLGLSPARVWPDSPSQEGGSASGNDDRMYFLNSDGSMDSQDDIGFPTVSRRARTRRRRGWARLDHDGNEIPTDEEEEYERSRTHMRVRAQALTQQRRTSVVASRSVEAITLPPSPPPPPFSGGVNPLATLLRGEPGILYADLTPMQSPTFRPRPTSRDSVSTYAPTIVASDQLDHVVANMAPTPFEPNPLPWSLLPPLSATPTPLAKHKREAPKARYSLWSPFAGR